jgi:nucleotide-binding universal stress UspA family protein
LTILVPLDGSALAEEALASAALLAEPLGARLHLLRVIEPPVYPLAGDGYAYVPFDDAAELLAAREYLGELAGRLRSAGSQVEIEVTVGLPNVVIPRVAQEQEAVVIAMATHGRGGLARLVLGSVATGTLQRAHVPLLLTRPALLDRPVPTPEPATPATDETTITLSLTPSELGLLQQAVESHLVSAHDADGVAASLRVILGKLRGAQPGGVEASKEVIGTR